MSIPEFLKQQRELKNELLPNNLQWLLELKDRFKPAIDFPNIAAFKPAIDILNFTSFKSTSPEWINYTKAFEIIESANSLYVDTSLFRDINEYSFRDYDFVEIIDAAEEEKEDAEIILIDETARIKKIITDIYYDNSVLQIIEPRQFEEIIAEILFSQGFKVELTKQTRDNGFDIIALKYIDGLVPLKFLVECKRYNRQKVGVEVIRSFKEVLATENANRGIIVTTSYFSKEAHKKRDNSPYLLDYKDKDSVIEWIQNYHMQRIQS
ncbi:MAG TPA: hypothetical protein DCQ50_21080 [Chryseobacterium sp.]|nr:hypothetical protein [Chryseobacterium sp.]